MFTKTGEDQRYLWRPFELQARRTPLLPLKTTLIDCAPGVVCIRIDNMMVRALSRLAGGYDYSVSYVVNGALMIDTGFPWAKRALRKALIAQGWDRTIKTVINTHYHEDHIGNNDLITDICDAKFFGSAATAVAARLPPRMHWYRRFLFGPLLPTKINVAPNILNIGQIMLQIIETPGHCPGHLCVFFPENGWLFSGDLFVAPDLDTQLPDVDGPDWIRSLEAILNLPVMALFDAHGTIIHGSENVRQVLRQKCDFLRNVEQRVREHLDASTSVEDLSNRVFKSRSLAEHLALGDGWMSVLTNSDFSRYHLVESFARPILWEQQARVHGIP